MQTFFDLLNKIMDISIERMAAALLKSYEEDSAEQIAAVERTLKILTNYNSEVWTEILREAAE